MKNERLLKFQDHFDTIIHDCQKFTFIARGKEFQIDACKRIDDFMQEIVKYKNEMVKEKNEFAANTLLSLKEMATALKSELQMIIKLKEDNPDEAWDNLIDAQMAIRGAMQAHPDGAAHLEGYVKKLSALERLFFPNQIFFSTGLVATESKCSICDSIYGECNHLLGKAYMGQLCHEVVTKSELKEISVVDNPSSKRCRTLKFEVDGISRNWMTLREEHAK